MSIQVRNPRTGQYDYEFTPPTKGELQARAERLRAASRRWSARTVAARGAVLQRWKDALQTRRGEILEALTTDTGRHLLSVIELDGTLRAIDRWCQAAPALLQEQEQQSVSMPSVKFRAQFVPFELVGVISPWNFPLTLSLIDAIPALLAGCGVIIKPSEVTPRFAAPLQRAINDVPELSEVLAVEPGDGATGAALIECVDAVCFTGSVKTGRLVAEAAARRFIPAFLELGGKDPVIVTAAADLDVAAATILRGAVANSGQACQSLERIYVDEAVYQPFVNKLVEQARHVTLNYPDLRHGQLGPLIFARQSEIIAAQLADASAKGATILCGGEIETHGGGLWMRPTVVTNVTHAMKLMTEETFGPVLPVMSYCSLDEAVALANDSEYGLSAAVFAGDLAEAEAIARRLNAGAISLNDGALTGLMNEAEKHSFKFSGLGGSRMGAASLLRFVRKKALLFQTGAPMRMTQLDEANAPRP